MSIVLKNYLKKFHALDTSVNLIQTRTISVKPKHCDAISVVRQLQENFHAANKTLCMTFVDQEKAFDRMPRRVSSGMIFARMHWGVAGASQSKHVWKCKKQSACWLQPESSVRKWEFTKTLAWTPYGSSRYWKPLPLVSYKMSLENR